MAMIIITAVMPKEITMAVRTSACGSGSVTPPGDVTATVEAAPGTNEMTPTTGPSLLSPTPDATVDARDYQQRNNCYFQSPTGNIMCGFVREGDLGVGCQLSKVTVIPAALLPTCDDSPAHKVAARIVSGKPEFMCVNQGFYVGDPVDGTNKGGGKVLEYGDTIVVRGTACTSTEQGVRCEAANHGFFVAADRQHLF